jgi:hypothetical protein
VKLGERSVQRTNRPLISEGNPETHGRRELGSPTATSTPGSIGSAEQGPEDERKRNVERAGDPVMGSRCGGDVFFEGRPHTGEGLEPETV